MPRIDIEKYFFELPVSSFSTSKEKPLFLVHVVVVCCRMRLDVKQTKVSQQFRRFPPCT